MALQFDTTTRNALLDAITTRVGSAGLLRIYTGAIPGAVSSSSTGTLLIEATCGSPFAPAAASATLSPTIPASVNASNSGTAGYYRVYKSDGTTCVMQNSVTATNPGLVLNPSNDLITSGQPFVVNSWQILAPGA